MATAQIHPQPQPMPIHHLEKKPAPTIVRVNPLKIGFMGEQGVGKTTSAGLLAVALSALYHDKAPVHVTDPELGWQYIEPVIFQPEGIKLVQRTVPTFAAMLQDITRAEKEGACVWAVELGKIWTEILRTLQKAKPVTWGSELSYMWTDFVAQFLNSKLHCLVLGRIQDVIEEVINEQGAISRIKTGEGMKAGGQRNNFGYEPNLVIRLYREQKDRLKRGKVLEAEGRVVHRAEITKDRTWALNGKVFRWPDRDGYKAGDFKYVYQSLHPHFAAVQKTTGFVTLDATASSVAIVDDNGDGEFFRNRQRKEAISAEIKASLDLFFGGQGKEDKQVRLAVCDLIFNVKSSEARDQLTLEQLERGYRILQAYEKRADRDLDSKETILAQIAENIADYDRGESEEQDIPF